MGTQSDTHFFFVTWAKERLDEMDAALASLEAKVGGVHADAREKANEVLAELHKSRDAFRDTVKKQAGANEVAWNSAKSGLETEWSGFQADVRKYVEGFSKQLGQQHVTFKVQADAQLKAWREAADALGSAAGEFASERRSEIDAAVTRMNADAIAAEKKLQDLAQAGTQSWAALTTALNETRDVFDRANQAAREAFKRAV